MPGFLSLFAAVYKNGFIVVRAFEKRVDVVYCKNEDGTGYQATLGNFFIDSPRERAVRDAKRLVAISLRERSV